MTTCLAGRTACPVIEITRVDRRLLRTVVVPAGRVFHRVGGPDHALDSLNPTSSPARFSPVPGRAVAYVGGSRTVALLETTFRTITPVAASRVVYAATQLRGRRLGRVVPSRHLRLLDLRDAQLARVGIPRDRLVASSPTHHPCTAAVGRVLLTARPGGQPVEGLLWNSRVAEVARGGASLLDDLLVGPSSEVAMVVGAPGDRPLAQLGLGIDLLDGAGRWPPLVDAIAEQLGAVIE